MSGRVAVVYFYMIGCPHCEAMRPAWEDAKKKLRSSRVELNEKEAGSLGSQDGVQSFPTIVMYKNGAESKRIEGSREKGVDIVRELGLGRRNSRRGKSYRGKRKTRNRTLRNYKALA